MYHLFNILMTKKRHTRKLIRDSTLRFLNRPDTDCPEATDIITYWLALPLPRQHQMLSVNSFGGFNYLATLETSNSIRMGHLRRVAPTQFLPCSDPYREYCDDEFVMLPTCETVNGECYRIPFELLPVIIDLITGYTYICNHPEGHGVRPDMRDSINDFILQNGHPEFETYFPINCYLFVDSFNPSRDFDRLSLQFLQHLGRLVRPCAKNINSTHGLLLRTCTSCLKCSALMLACANCRMEYYCDSDCQRKDWSRHKDSCYTTKW
jgi:hypothetical protein